MPPKGLRQKQRRVGRRPGATSNADTPEVDTTTTTEHDVFAFLDTLENLPSTNTAATTTTNTEPIVVPASQDAPQGDGQDADQDFDIDVEARDWIATQVAAEEARLRDMDASVTVLAVANYGLLVEEDEETDEEGTNDRTPTLTNRVELKSTFDFTLIQQMLVSDPVPYPARPSHRLVFVLLVPSPDMLPFLVPYLYDAEFTPEDGPWAGKYLENRLQEWLLINADGQRARHVVKDGFA
ncbi:hypothetical protein BC828DRAFT_380452 [Blastocladiella britannica]|nr:hypothetical protein BC828DRAFT_380452 [Blastocladiella britannica]